MVWVEGSNGALTLISDGWEAGVFSEEVEFEEGVVFVLSVTVKLRKAVSEFRFQSMSVSISIAASLVTVFEDLVWDFFAAFFKFFLIPPSAQGL